MNKILSAIKPGFQVFMEERAEECGGVRAVAPEGRDEIVVYIENAGDFTVNAEAIRRAHDSKVILDPTRLDKDLLTAIAHAHEREEPGL
jgi:hypothetical protein